MFRFTDIIIFRMTKACNLNCKYCFMKDRPPNNPENYIKQELLERVIDQIILQRTINNKRNHELILVLHGGEVLILGPERLRKILNYIETQFNKYGIEYSLSTQTNATLLNDEIASLLARYNVNVGMSFDGIDGANDGRTNIKEAAYHKNFELLNRHKVNFGFIVVASKNNLDKLGKSQRYIESLNDSATYKINYAEDMDTPGPESPVEIEGSEFFETVYKPELERFIQTGTTRESELVELIRNGVADITTDHTRQIYTGCGSKSCGSALHMIAIEPDGDMDICDRFSQKFDDPQIHMQHALDYDFLALHQIKRAMQFHTSNNAVIKKTGCDGCPADYICKHGCMSFHYSKFNQTWGVDTYLVCGLYKNLFKYLQEHLVEILDAYLQSMGGFYRLSTGEAFYNIKPNIKDYLDAYGINISIEEEGRAIYFNYKEGL